MSLFNDILQTREMLASLIFDVLAFHPRSLRLLLGKTPSPTSKEFFDLYPHQRSEGKSPSPSPWDLIEIPGGWPAIQNATRKVREKNPLAWNIFAEYLMWVGQGSRLSPCGHLERIARKYGVGVATIYRKKKAIPLLIAKEVLGLLK